MKRTSNWHSRVRHKISFGIAALLAVGTNAAVASASPIDDLTNPLDQNKDIKSEEGEGEYSLCSPNFGSGKTTFGNTLTIEDDNGNRITDISDLTFEVRAADGTSLNITNQISPIEISYGLQGFPFVSLFETNPFEGLPSILAPGLYFLQCQTTSNNVALPFPQGTTIVAVRNSEIIASADVSNRNLVDFQNTKLSQLMTDELDQDFINSCIMNTVKALDTEPCAPFTDIYGFVRNKTGKGLHRSLSYFIVAVIGIVYKYELFNENIVPGSTALGSTSLRRASIKSISTQSTPPPEDQCLASFDAILNTLEEPNESTSTLGLFELTQYGRDLAESFSDLTVTSWPDIDSCFTAYEDDPTDSFDDMRMVFPEFLFSVYLSQLMLIDIPNGTVNSDLGGLNGTSLPFRLRPTPRPQENAPAAITANAVTTTTTPIKVKKSGTKQSLPETGQGFNELTAAIALLTLGMWFTVITRRRHQ